MLFYSRFALSTDFVIFDVPDRLPSPPPRRRHSGDLSSGSEEEKSWRGTRGPIDPDRHNGDWHV